MWLLNLINSDTLSCDRLLEQNLRLYTKCHWNRVIPAWFIAIKLFSRWRPSAVLNFWNLVLWSRDLCQNVILLLRTKFSVSRTINRSDVAKKRFFDLAAVRHFEFAKFWYFVMWLSFGTKFASVHQISLKSCDSFLIYSDKIIFKMAAIRHLKFLKFGIVVMWPVSERDSASSYQIFSQSDNI